MTKEAVKLYCLISDIPVPDMYLPYSEFYGEDYIYCNGSWHLALSDHEIK